MTNSPQTVFYTALNKYQNMLDSLQVNNVVLDDPIAVHKSNTKIEEDKEEEKEDQEQGDEQISLDETIKNLQLQLLATKAENIEAFRKLHTETNSYFIPEQDKNLNIRREYIRKCVVPLKEMSSKLLEEGAELE